MIPIIIVLYKMPEIERHCLERVASFTDRGKTELVVVDNGLENRPLGGLLNELIADYDGWNSERDQVGVLLDTDCFVTSNWLEKLLKVIRSSDRIGFVGPVTDNCRSKQKVPLDHRIQHHEGQVLYDEMLSAFCLMFRRQAWEDADGFATDGPFYGQETALIWNAMRKGWRTAIVQDCWVKHIGSVSAKAASLRGEFDYVEERKKGRQWYLSYKLNVFVAERRCDQKEIHT